MNASDFFTAGAVFGQYDGEWCVWGVTTNRYPNDVKLPGGNNTKGNGDPQKCLYRELLEEVGIEVYGSILVHTSTLLDHQKYFFLVLDWHKSLAALSVPLESLEGVYSRSFRDIDTARWRRESDGAYIWPRSVPLKTFWRFCFENHREGFREAARHYLLHLQQTGSEHAESFVRAVIAAGIPYED